jgi:hypothetical protein
MSQWDVWLVGKWQPLGDQEKQFLDRLERSGETSGDLVVRGAKYSYDVKAMTQTNVATSKSRRIRHQAQVDSAINAVNAYSTGTATGPPIPKEPSLTRSVSVSTDDTRVVQVWLAGEWRYLGAAMSKEISDRQSRGEVKFQVSERGHRYEIDLALMTQSNLVSQRTRTIRFANLTADPTVGFDEFREAFKKKVPSKELREEALRELWPAAVSAGLGDRVDHSRLVNETAHRLFLEMDLRQNKKVDMVMWNHYWALERDGTPFHAGREANDKLREAVNSDPQVLGRMQMHFETEIEAGAGNGGTLSSAGLLKACERLVAGKNVIEKQWAAEVLQKHRDGEDLDDDMELTYFDFLNLMLGRKKYKVSLWMYDISDGYAKNLSWALLGQTFEGIWHTGVVIEWPEKTSEFWFGGSLFESEPGTSPFGQPMHKKSLGHTYKPREEVWNYVARHCAHEFTKAKYDVLTHNCNHFSDKLSMFLRNDHIPDEVRKQPEMVMNTVTARALRPLLNRWLGGFNAEDGGGRATDGGEAAMQMWMDVLPGATVIYAREEGGRPQVGEVLERFEHACSVVSLDFWQGRPVERDVPRELISQVIHKAPEGSRYMPPSQPPQTGRWSQGHAGILGACW